MPTDLVASYFFMKSPPKPPGPNSAPRAFNMVNDCLRLFLDRLAR